MNTLFRSAFALTLLVLVAQSVLASSPGETALGANQLRTAEINSEASTTGPLGLPSPVVNGLRGAVNQSSCSATAYCGSNPSVTCTGNASCSSVDRSCPGVGGAVTCDGVITACSTNQSCAQGCAATWQSCVAQCPSGILNPCRIACSEERAACHCNC